MGTNTESWQRVSRIREQRNHPRGRHQRLADGHHQPPVRSLLQAAGMAPMTDEPPVDDPGACGLPLIDLLDTHEDRTRYCAATTVNDRGRLADQTPLKVMDWPPETPITISMLPSAGIIIVRRTGPDAVTRQGHLRIPANIRHGCRIRGGDRLLVVAHPHDGVLVGYTAYALDAMASAYHTSLTAEDKP